MKEATSFKFGCMHKDVYDLLMLRNFKVAGLLSNVPKSIHVYWLAPIVGWIKLDMDGAADDFLSPVIYADIFHNAWGFTKGCFLFASMSYLHL